MSTPFDAQACVASQASLLGLEIAPEHLPGVVRYLQLAAGLAPRVMDFALTPADESGNTFRPVPAAAVQTGGES